MFVSHSVLNVKTLVGAFNLSIRDYEPSCGPSFQAQLLPGHQPQPHQRQPGGPRHLAVIHWTSRLERGGNHKVNSSNGSYNQYIQHPVAFSDTYFFPRYSY